MLRESVKNMLFYEHFSDPRACHGFYGPNEGDVGVTPFHPIHTGVGVPCPCHPGIGSIVAM